MRRTLAGFWKSVILAVAVLEYISTFSSVSAVCDFSFVDRNKLYNYSLASPIRNFPHGVRSEDGYYKVAANGTTVWFQLCDGMIFNHHPPVCFDCMDCGGPSRCGMGCSALVAEKIDGYPVCTTIGSMLHMTIDVMDKKNPHNGVLVKMWHRGYEYNCSLTVSLLCDSKEVQGPHSLEKQEKCDYTATLKHPSGCANILSVHGGGLGWFGTFMIIGMIYQMPLPIWRVSVCRCRLPLLFTRDTWYRCYTKFGSLGKHTPQDTELLRSFSKEIQRTFRKPPSLILRCQLLSIRFTSSKLSTPYFPG